jgi:hypothetical protein
MKRTARVMRWRGLPFALLICVAFDLALVVLPGALVFDSEDSVDRLEIERAAVLPSLTRVECVRFQVPIDVGGQLVPPLSLGGRLARTSEFALGCCGMTRLPRATLDSALSSEDSHSPSVRL